MLFVTLTKYNFKLQLTNFLLNRLFSGLKSFPLGWGFGVLGVFVVETITIYLQNCKIGL